jgi:trigger factor
LGFENIEELRSWVRADLESRIGEAVRRGMAGQVYQYLLDSTQFELPGRMSERQTQRVMLRRMLELSREGTPPAEVEKHLDELKAGAQEATARELKLFFIMNRLAELIEVEVSESEMNAQIAAIAQRQNRRFDRVRDQLAKEGSLADLYLQIRDEKIVDQLIAKAQITEATPEEIEAEQKAKAEPAAARAPGKGQPPEAGSEGAEPAAEQPKPKRPRRKPPSKQETDLQDET